MHVPYLICACLHIIKLNTTPTESYGVTCAAGNGDSVHKFWNTWTSPSSYHCHGTLSSYSTNSYTNIVLGVWLQSRDVVRGCVITVGNLQHIIYIYTGISKLFLYKCSYIASIS